MKNRITRRLATAAILSVLIMALLCASAFAASYSNTYGRTKDRLRVRASASQSATVIDNILKDACVYISTTKDSGAATFVKVTYRNLDGNIDTGWICQHDGNETLVTILSASQAQSLYGVKSGNLPSKKVGTFTASERAAAEKKAGSVDSGSIDTDTVKDAQRMLKDLDYYTGEITGHVGEKTESAIKKFQRDYNLSADGIVGPNTYAKLQSVYASKGGSSSSSSSSGSGLRLNSSGTEVRNLQQDLTTLKYYWAEITGNYGEKTEAAVERFQKDNNLTPDGVAGQKTLDAIAAALNRSGLSSSSSISSSSTLSKGSKSEAVRELQTALKALGYYTGSITGSFGDLTEAAVREFQRANKLTEDGVAGPATIREINAQASSGSSGGSRLDLGSTGQLVHALQRDLTALGYYYGDITSHYGEMTKQAVKKFQKDNGLTADGVAGPSTQNAISRKLGNSGSLASANSSADSLRLGDSGTAVTDLQTRLEKLDYYYGEITGNFGNLTERAVKKFQDDNDLSVDGVAGNKTLSLLYQKTGGTYAGTGSGESNVNLYGRITANNVSLRQSYSKSSKAVVELDSGKVMRITKSVTVDGMVWYYGYVEKGNYTYKGYMRSDYVTLINDSDYIAGGGDEIDVGDDEILGMIRVTGDKVSIREDHSNDSDRVGYAYKDDVYYYINTRSYDDGWYQIASGGWISKKYCTKLSESEMDQYAGLGSSSQTSYRIGDKGSMVTWIQEALDELDYYDGEITGNYGNLTHDAVQDFQRDHGLSGDGIAGEKTIAAISAALSSSGSGSTSSVGSTAPKGPIIYNLDWFTYKTPLTSSSHFNLKAGAYATLTDIETGKSFDIKIQSTGNHIDAEPRDAEDTRILAYVYGKSSGAGLKGVYQRRPMVLTSSTGKSVIVSIYPDPHGLDTISGNGYDGQFCLHMKNSKTHGTDRVDYDDNGHQEMIEKGVTYLLNNQFERDYYSVSTAYPATAASVTTNKKGTHSSGSNTSSDNGSTGGVNNSPFTEAVAPVTFHKDTTVYWKSSWKYYHTDSKCESLTANDVSTGKTTYGNVSAAAKDSECPKCKPVWVYFGNTSTANYHYAANCSNLAEHGYTGLWKSTEEHILAKTKRTHVCSRCDSTGKASGGSTSTTVATSYHKDTIAYTYPSWTYYHLTNKCDTYLQYKTSQSGNGYTTVGALDSSKKLCEDCAKSAVNVYYGDTSTYSYHYSSSCEYLKSMGYSNIYKTTEFTAQIRDRDHDCSKCKK